MDSTRHVNREIPQSEPADPRQVRNAAGGYTFRVDYWGRLERFLILGSEGGTYYASERALTAANAQCVTAAAMSDPARAARLIVDVSVAGRAAKVSPTLFALALMASHERADVRSAAWDAFPEVCRTGSHVLELVSNLRRLGGSTGRRARRAIGTWYASRAAGDLAFQVAKYRNRFGMTHRDVLRLAHPRADGETAAVVAWAAGKPGDAVPEFLAAFDELRATVRAERVAHLVSTHGFSHEMVPTEFKTEPAVWHALLPRMPLGAMVRNLGAMSARGALDGTEWVELVRDRLTDAGRVRRARLHPIAVLSALNVYARGRGARGSLTWDADARVVDALDDAFYASFAAVEPTGRRTLLALDVSGSMDWGEIAGVPGLTPRAASAAMAMVTARAEAHWRVMAFSHAFVPVTLSPRQRLDDVVRAVSGIRFGGTDCALPMLWARENAPDTEVFTVYTDNETWAGRVHPHVALRDYREATGIPAKLAVVGMTATESSITDPDDAGMLDVVGFDTAAPNLLADFARSC